jgi:hypothetical protein
MTYEEKYAKALAKLAKRENAIMKKRFGNRMETAMQHGSYKIAGARGAAARNAKQEERK